ncbi:MAG: type II toxin-antitoxin system VapB family antitoxin [Anaeroplasmataceae bacterium]|nr:type II toxin-antitoxin system VapB family antitoxin [Anaeroplasmataceae bacterium]MDE6415365.1 type II toxin-antitoxin system VapB family antitoxin [Anaeroplasmataceae bacterium]
MPKPKKEFKVLNIKIDLEIANLLEKYAYEAGQTKTIVVERALKEYINKSKECKKQ